MYSTKYREFCTAKILDLLFVNIAHVFPPHPEYSHKDVVSCVDIFCFIFESGLSSLLKENRIGLIHVQFPFDWFWIA